VLGEGHVGRALGNSLIVASGTMVICLHRRRARRVRARALALPVTHLLLMAILMTQMFLLVVLVIPLFVMMRKADLLGTYWSLIIYLAFSVPLAIWVMQLHPHDPGGSTRGARIDGATRIGPWSAWCFRWPRRPGHRRRPRLPRGLEGVLLALTFLNDEDKKTMPLVLQSFVGRGDVDWPR
jgi:ABC-type glycerol-3-phosphate transport system permease component